ncbi:hypothetical protein BDZ45DRAFT_364009 [Acephala macrosclerotiorum]|nr:hypothetical protein BDZ45DRAFT_364009 [Acephala macrosclerotiorum]
MQSGSQRRYGIRFRFCLLFCFTTRSTPLHIIHVDSSNISLLLRFLLSFGSFLLLSSLTSSNLRELGSAACSFPKARTPPNTFSVFLPSTPTLPSKSSTSHPLHP